MLVTVHVTIAAVWLFTLPLTIARFNLVSPVGFFVNVVLAPLVVVILWCGYALLLVGLVAPALAAPFAFGFDASMRLMLWLIERAAAIPGGHVYLPGPSDGWLAGFYACLAAVAFGLPGGRLRWWGWRAMLIWIVGGLSAPLWPHRTDELRCTFLAVGHGLAVVVELPRGRTLVYDAGQMQDGARAMQSKAALWQRGCSVDAPSSHMRHRPFQWRAGFSTGDDRQCCARIVRFSAARVEKTYDLLTSESRSNSFGRGSSILTLVS